MDVTEHDHRSGYCRMLGHHLSFAYCRSGCEGRPCVRILDCWFERFDVRDFVGRHYPAALAPGLASPPGPKVAALVELIRQARQRAG